MRMEWGELVGDLSGEDDMGEVWEEWTKGERESADPVRFHVVECPGDA